MRLKYQLLGGAGLKQSFQQLVLLGNGNQQINIILFGKLIQPVFYVFVLYKMIGWFTILQQGVQQS